MFHNRMDIGEIWTRKTSKLEHIIAKRKRRAKAPVFFWSKPCILTAIMVKIIIPQYVIPNGSGHSENLENHVPKICHSDRATERSDEESTVHIFLFSDTNIV